MSVSKCIKPHATNRSEHTLRGLVLVMALTSLLFPVAARADTVGLDDGTLTLLVFSGQGDRPIGQTLEASGPGFSVALRAGGTTGPTCPSAFPQPPCLPGSLYFTGTLTLEVVFGTATYAGVTYSLSGGPA